jgi:PAS domain S-box-containing protein
VIPDAPRVQARTAERLRKPKWSVGTVSDSDSETGAGHHGPVLNVDPAQILAAIDHDRNRRLLRDFLSPHHAVDESDPREASWEDVDCVIVDPPALERCAEFLADRREEAKPAFLPVLLVSPIETGDLDPDVWAYVDDVVSTPVSRNELGARIEGLLERARLSRDLLRSENRFRILIRMAPDPVFVLEDTGALEIVNEAFAELFGIPSEECLGRPLEAVTGFKPSDLEPKALADTPGERDLIHYVGPEQSVSFLEASVRPIEDDGERYHIGHLHDVSEQVRRTKELQRQNDRLEEFASTLAHELRNPLNIASGWLHGASDDLDAETFDRIDTAHERMGDMIDELLQLARQGEVVRETDTVSLSDVARDAWEAFDTRDAALCVEIDDAVTVDADPKRLRDVLINLFKNSVIHGGEDVTVRLGEFGPGDIFVADDGQGFVLDDPEAALETGVTTSEEGTGYGLAVVDQIVTAHGWELTARPSESSGARFEIRNVGLAPE